VTEPVLELTDLEVAYRVRGIERPVVRGVSLRIIPGDSYGLVGESGCGKSTIAYAAVRYLPRNGRVTGGRVRFEGRDVLALDDEQTARLRMQGISMVYQNPIASLNPTIRVGAQVAEVFRLLGSDRAEATRRAQDALAQVQIADPERVMRRYPHQLSGGMAQRVVIAMALAKNPRLLVLDEPTTGLDATVEAEVLELVRTLRRTHDMAVLFISHNLGVIRHMCDRVGVLYAGALVEEGPTATLLASPTHPYTAGLLRCIPRGGLHKSRQTLDTIAGTPPPLGADLPGCVFVDRCELADDGCRAARPPATPTPSGQSVRCFHWDRTASIVRKPAGVVAPSATAASRAPLVDVRHVSKTFVQDAHAVRVLTDVSFGVGRGETLGLVGESGSGKTTLAHSLLGLVGPEAGSVVLDGKALAATLSRRDHADVGAMQIVFQNPDQALNRRHSVARIVARAVERLGGLAANPAMARAHELLSGMRVDETLHGAKPFQLSGGLKQRVAISRAFAGTPQLVVCDEPTSALDVSVQAAILNLLVDLQRTDGVSYIFISHDLGVVRYISDKIAVLYLGRVVEFGPSDVVFAGPHHPYTEALLSAVPNIDGSVRARIPLEGQVPSPSNPPSGCVLHPRCPRRAGSGVEHLCDTEEPELAEVEPGHFMRCHIPLAQLREVQVAAPTRR
jgi:peptide/nickel transport system ATP-binding protein